MKVAILSFAALVSAVAIAPPPTVPDVQTFPGTTRKDTIVKRIRYGPHKLKKAVVVGTETKGTKTTIVNPTVQKPCDDCTLVSMNGRVQYANGTEAESPAVYLHHAAIINNGPEAKDGTCSRPAYDLFFSTGNERSTIFYNNPNATMQAGYYIHKSDNFVLQSEIVNNEADEKEIWVTMNYEYVPGKLPGLQQTKVIWLSADGSAPCERKSDLAALIAGVEPKLGAGELYPPNDKSFTLKSKPWTSPWTGNFIALGGHIHDGGINAEIYQNGKLLCNSLAKYASGDSAHGMAGGHSTNTRHIASMSGCITSDSVKAGDQFQVVVNYDFEKNPGMRDKENKLLPIMAAATLFIGAT